MERVLFICHYELAGEIKSKEVVLFCLFYNSFILNCYTILSILLSFDFVVIMCSASCLCHMHSEQMVTSSVCLRQSSDSPKWNKVTINNTECAIIILSMKQDHNLLTEVPKKDISDDLCKLLITSSQRLHTNSV
jgi:hypothetical protein